MTQVQLINTLPLNHIDATKAEGKLLMQRAQDILKNSKRNLTRRKKPFLKDALNTLHRALNKFIDKHAKLRFLQEFIVQLKFVRVSVKRRITALV